MGQQIPLTWILFDRRRVYRCCVSSSGVSAHRSERTVFRIRGKRKQMASPRCVYGCGESWATVRVDKERFCRRWKYLVFQPAECSPTFWIRAFVGTGEDLVLRLGGRGCAHWGGVGGKEGGGGDVCRVNGTGVRQGI